MTSSRPDASYIRRPTLHAVEIPVAEGGRQGLDRQEVVAACRQPTLAVAGQRAAGNDAMQVDVV